MFRSIGSNKSAVFNPEKIIAQQQKPLVKKVADGAKKFLFGTTEKASPKRSFNAAPKAPARSGLTPNEIDSYFKELAEADSALSK